MPAAPRTMSIMMVAAVVVLAAGCTAAPGPPAASASATATAEPAAATLPPDLRVCSLLTTAEVTELLGVPPKLPPSSRGPFPDIQVACGWAGTDAHGGRVQAVVTVTSRVNGYDAALGRQPGVVALTGIGDKAAFVPPGTIGTVTDRVFVEIAATGPLTGSAAQDTLRRDLLAVVARAGL